VNRGELRSIIKATLALKGIETGYYQNSEIDNHIQDAYDYTIANSLCHIKFSPNINWLSYENYYDFKSLGIQDYIGTVGIFNNNDNLWLRDNVPARLFDGLRIDWELWIGNPQFWSPHSLRHIAIAPRFNVAVGTLRCLYYAEAPALNSDSDGFVIAPDQQDLLEWRALGTLLEEAEESQKALTYMNDFEDKFVLFQDRCRAFARSDAIKRVGESIPR